jgi:2',3'-cyclic-nucleotide 2'-phosphodiesterase (5'-nucleotidase family)
MPQAVFWVETKGKTLEEIDAIFEGHKHSNVPDVELVRRGKAHIDVGVVEQEIHSVVQTAKLE